MLHIIIGEQLPKYMVPYIFVELENFPLTPNKKVDRKALNQLEIIKSVNEDKFQYPKTELQKQLLAYWKEVLKYDFEISTEDNFFSIGGHSLNGVKLIHLINKELQYSINLKTLFDFSTIESLSNYLSNLDKIETKKISISKQKIK